MFTERAIVFYKDQMYSPKKLQLPNKNMTHNQKRFISNVRNAKSSNGSGTMISNIPVHPGPVDKLHHLH